MRRVQGRHSRRLWSPDRAGKPRGAGEFSFTLYSINITYMCNTFVIGSDFFFSIVLIGQKLLCVWFTVSGEKTFSHDHKNRGIVKSLFPVARFPLSSPKLAEKIRTIELLGHLRSLALGLDDFFRGRGGRMIFAPRTRSNPGHARRSSHPR